jgi:glucokinase
MNKVAIGIDIGGTRTKIGLVDLNLGKVLEMIISSAETVDSNLFLKNIAKALEDLK